MAEQRLDGRCMDGGCPAFTLLRQERRNVGFDRNPTWLIEDLFCCSKCLQYKRVAVEKRQPKQDSLMEEHVERLV